jgi:2-(1,2-epoxy-1,2-dihydrophenyl)acetyl-CoA isomerase
MTDGLWPSTDGISVTLDDGLLVCVIDRPDRGNALRTQDTVVLADALDRVSATGEARAVLLRAEGRHFCTGAELSGDQPDQKPPTGHLRRDLAAGFHRLLASIWHCRVPVVTAVGGRADGAGLHIATAAHLIVAGRSARFSEPFALRGFSTDSGGTWLLPRRVGLTRATRMLLTGDPVAAEEAEAWGLVSMVVDDEALEKTARELARKLAAGPTLALSLINELLDRHGSGPVSLETAMREEALAVELSVRSDDFKEGIRAFLGKRPPNFTGR